MSRFFDEIKYFNGFTSFTSNYLLNDIRHDSMLVPIYEKINSILIEYRPYLLGHILTKMG